MGFNISNQRYVKVIRGTTLSHAVSGTPQTIDWSAGVKNSNGMWEGVTNPSRLTANRPGWYSVKGYVSFAANATGDRELRIIKNGAAAAIVGRASVKSATLITALQVHARVYLNVGDYVQLVANQTSTAALDMTATAAEECPSFSMCLELPEAGSSGAFERD